MSIEDRRNSLRKSSLGIDNIRKSITSLNEGLVAIGTKSRDLLKQTRETNLFKRKLIRQDGEFFKRRRENALRKQREDELEASTITGVTKRQGSLVQKSTRGFLGRILDFLGILLLGWALTNLPKIIAAFQKLFGLIKRVVGVLSGFIEGMKNFLVGIGTGISNFLDIFKRFNFSEDDKKIRDTLEESQNNLTKLNKDFVESAQQFANDPDINSASQVAEDIGVTDGEGGGDSVTPSGFGKVNEKDIKEKVQKNLDDNVDPDNELGGDAIQAIEGGNIMPAAASEISDEEARRIIEEEDAVDSIEGVDASADEEELVLTDDDVGGSENIEGVNENDPMSVTPSTPSGSAPSSTATTTNTDLSDEDMLPEPEEGYANIEGMFNPVGSSDKSSSITPVKRSRNNLQGRRRRKRTIVKVNNQSGGVGAPSMNNGGTKSKTIFVGQSSEQTLLDLQSLNNKHN